MGSSSSCLSAPRPASGPPSSRAAAVLCLASRNTTARVEAFCRERGLRLTAVSDVAGARSALAGAVAAGDPYDCVVAALGIDDRTRIFDLAGDRSTLIAEARAARAYVVVYSHTACRTPGYKIACEDAGADVVLCSNTELAAVYDDTIAQIQMAKRSSASSVSVNAAHDTATPRGIKSSQEAPDVSTGLEYPPVTSRRGLEAFFARALALPDLNDQRAFKQVTRPRRRLLKQLAMLRRPLCVVAGRGGSSARVRCVHVSDTHNQHLELQLPDGDCLVHTGDAVGNYGPQHNIIQHFESYMRWLTRAAERYEHVVFIAGNHDTLLDADCYDATAARRLVAALPDNVTYLENNQAILKFSGARTLKFWGSPCTPSRLESLGKRYYSDAFERVNEYRQQLWKTMPGDVDVLLTHVPPRFDEDQLVEPTYGGVSLTSYGDPLLSARLNTLASKETIGAPPRFHCFGHDHGGFGVAQNASTTFLNGAQEEVVRNDRKARNWAAARTDAAGIAGMGCPLVFDA
eukprot:g5314.t1